MTKFFHRDSLVIITSGTLTVGNTTYPISGIRSFRVTATARLEQDWPKTFKMFGLWLLGVTVGIIAIWLVFVGQNVPFVLLFLGLLGAIYATWRGEYKNRITDRWWLSIDTAGRSESVVSSPNERYIRDVASHLGAAMAER